MIPRAAKMKSSERHLAHSKMGEQQTKNKNNTYLANFQIIISCSVAYKRNLTIVKTQFQQRLQASVNFSLLDINESNSKQIPKWLD